MNSYNKFIQKGFSLKNYGLSEMGCEKNIALELIEYLDKENCDIGILGGDVYLIKNSVPESLCDNWASEQEENESIPIGNEG